MILLPALAILPYAIAVLFYTNGTRLNTVSLSSLLQADGDVYFNAKSSVGLLCPLGKLVHNVCRTGVYDYKNCDEEDKKRQTKIGIQQFTASISLKETDVFTFY